MKIVRRKLIFGLFAMITFAGIIGRQVNLKKEPIKTNSFSIKIYLRNSGSKKNATVVEHFGLKEVSLIDGFAVSSKEL